MKKFLQRGIAKGYRLGNGHEGPPYSMREPSANRGIMPLGDGRFFQPVPKLLWAVTLVFVGLSCLTANPLLTAFCVLLVPIFMSLLWLRDQPPVLVFACVMQLRQAAMAVFYTDFYGIPLSEGSRFGGVALVEATWLSLIGILVLAFGMRLALLGYRSDEAAARAKAETSLVQPDRVFILYIIAFVVFSFVERLAFSISLLRQPLLATGKLRWMLAFLLAYAVLRQRRGYVLLIVALGLEFVTGLLGYFAGFMDIFFVLLVALPGAHFVVRGWKKLAQVCAMATVILVLGITWTAIKGDYREFLNQGSGQQEVVVSVDQRLEKLSNLVSGLNQAKLEDGLEDTVLRMSYVKFFALTIENVPEYVPYENGGLWWGTIQHVLMPRFLFPNKPALDDSARTNYYTGARVAGAEEGTSIGIGYIGESYIDFGPIGMFLPILLLGLFYGFIYRFFVHRAPVKVIGLALATSILIFGAYNLETSNIKLVGGNLTSLLVMGLFLKLGGWWFWGIISRQGPVLPSLRRDRDVAIRLPNLLTK